MSTNHSRCGNCDNSTPVEILEASYTESGHSLCRSCLANHKMKIENSTWEAISLCLSLKKRGVEAVIDHIDGGRSINGIGAGLLVNIEVEGHQPVRQAITDEKLTGRSFRKGMLTIRIPDANNLTDANPGLNETAEYITDFLHSGSNRNKGGL